MLGAAQGAIEAAVLIATSQKYTFSSDWFLGLMIVFANATGFAIASRYGLNLFGVAVAGLAGMMVGGWLGVRLIGSYEYTVPTPPEERQMRITSHEGERILPMPGVPAETVKRVPIGGGLGVLLGWVAGVVAYARLFRPRDDVPDSETHETEP